MLPSSAFKLSILRFMFYMFYLHILSLSIEKCFFLRKLRKLIKLDHDASSSHVLLILKIYFCLYINQRNFFKNINFFIHIF